MPTQPPKLKRGSYLQTIKAVYIGLEAQAGDDAELEAALDAARGTTDGAELEARRAKQEFAQVRTGEDAIKFFTRYGGDGGAAADVRVLYCNRATSAPDGGKAGPYDLVVVPKEQAAPEYFTISVNGVVHFQPGQLSECTALAEWMQHTLLFRVLCSMTFFRLYPHRKALWEWSASARYSSYCRRRARFARRCFLAKPLFVGPLMQMRQIVASAGEVPLVQLPDACSSLSDFAELQQRTSRDPVQGAGRELERRQEVLCAALERLAASVLGASRDLAAADKGAAVPLKGKPMAQEKREAQELARRQLLLKEDEGRLGSCIRLASCTLQGAMVGALQSAAAELRGRVARAAEGPRKFLTVQVALSDRGGGVDLDPPVPVFQQAFATLWKDAAGCVDALPRLCGMSPNLRAVADSCGGAEDGAKVGEVLAQDLPFQEATTGAWRELEAQVLEALAFAQSELAEPCGRIQNFADSWSSAAYLKKEHTFAGIERDIEQAQALQQSLSRCRVQRVFGSIFLDARTLRDRLAPVPEAALATMMQALAALARERCGEAFHRLDVCVKRLEEKPETSSGYAAYAEYYETAVREQSSLEPVVEQLRDVYELLRQLGFRISVEDRVQIEETLRREKQLADRSLLEARLFLDRNTPLPSEGEEESAEAAEAAEAEATETQAQPSVTVTIETALFEGTARSMSLIGVGGD